MKKFISFMLILSILLTLSGCVDLSGINKVNFNSINYNNVYDTYNTFWAEGDTVFYDSPGFYTKRAFIYNNGKKTRLLHSLDFDDEYYDGSFVPLNDFAYFGTTNNTNDKSYIYKYSFSNRKYKKILTTDLLSTWIGTENFIGFTKWKEDNDFEDEKVELYDLYVYDIKNKKEILICKDIYEFGIVDNMIRYVTPADSDTILVYEYNVRNGKTKDLGSITTTLDYIYPTFNFTKNFVTITQLEAELIVYSIGGETKKYTLPKTINQFIAGEQFAYALCYNENEYGGAKGGKEEGIYRIKLSDGTFKRISYSVESNSKSSDIDFSDVDFRVASDDEIYIIQGDWGQLVNFLYKSHVYRINVSKNTKKKLFTY